LNPLSFTAASIPAGDHYFKCEEPLVPPPKKPRVLIVDDKAANRTAFEAVLEKEFSVTAAESGAQAVDLCRREDFAVIVLDVRMPDMNGFDTAEALRKLEATRTTPIIIFTSAYEQHFATISRGFQAGATDFIFSPVEPELLKLKVTTYAQIYLRHEALRLQVQQLKEALARLNAELSRRGQAVTEVRSRLDQVERTASEIDRQTQ
jgi:CheY-like chemotaxis protein